MLLIFSPFFILANLFATTVTISPDRSQFFRYESISLRCLNSSLTVRRTTSHRTAQSCSDDEHRWALTKGDSCVIRTAYPADTGEYWCESEQETCRSSINITVTGNGSAADEPITTQPGSSWRSDRGWFYLSAGVVILESPPYPINEGDVVTLRCSYRKQDGKKSTSNFSANFYKDDVFIGTDAAGQITLTAESKSEGFYKCQHPSEGESLRSWLTVKS